MVESMNEESPVKIRAKKKDIECVGGNGKQKLCSLKKSIKKQSDIRTIGKGEGSFGHNQSSGRMYAVTFMVNSDEIYARKFSSKIEAIEFKNSDTGIINWRKAHPENNDLIGKIIEIM